ncbi:MAG: TadE/TadG family type IV pilus assembly protein [Angustibacter sp.]
MAIEMVLLAPVLFAFALLVVACGRYVDVRGELQATAREAARAASLERSSGAAQSAASRVAAAQVPARVRCSDVVVEYRPGDPVAGRIGLATARLSCRVSYAGLGLIGLPGGADLAASSSAPIDPYRRTQR